MGGLKGRLGKRLSGREKDRRRGMDGGRDRDGKGNKPNVQRKSIL